MFICASKFDIEGQQLAMVSEFLSDEDKEQASEEGDTRFLNDLDPIRPISHLTRTSESHEYAVGSERL